MVGSATLNRTDVNVPDDRVTLTTCGALWSRANVNVAGVALRAARGGDVAPTVEARLTPHPASASPPITPRRRRTNTSMSLPLHVVAYTDGCASRGSPFNTAINCPDPSVARLEQPSMDHILVFGRSAV